jgi:hypothetical protein
MFDVAAALYSDSDFSKQVSRWQSVDEAEWRARGDGLLAQGKGVSKLLRAQPKSFLGRIASALGGPASDEMVKESMSELVREAPLVVAWTVDAEGRPAGRRAWAAATIDAGASLMRTLFDAERLGLGAQSCSIMLDTPPGGASGEARVKQLLSIPASCEIVNVARIGKHDHEDTPPSVTWRSDVRRDAAQVVFQEKLSGV